MKKKITIEDLAAMVNHGFIEVEKKMATGFTEMEKKMATKEDLAQLEKKMENGFYAVNRRIDLLHEDISDLPDIREELKDHGERRKH